jgi:glycosyltransferase involved in cell wall biosynthesis
MKPRIALFTSNYPFKGNGGEVPFLRPEIPHLLEKFDVSVFPRYTDGPNLDPDVGYSLDTSLAQMLGKISTWEKILYGMSSPRFYIEILNCLGRGKRPNMREILTFAFHYEAVRAWLSRCCKENYYSIFYTYWCNATTAALVAECRSSAIITRLHGFDLYEERHRGGYIPGLRYTLSNIKKAICISIDGVRYLENRGVEKSKISLYRIGVPRQQILTKKSEDGTLRILSVSFVIALKRVGAIYQALIRFAEISPQMMIEWTHIGDGPEFQYLKEQIESEKVYNLACNLLGHLENKDVIAFYSSHPIDLFMHASESEGLPVCIQEALSFGVPVIATDVGGVSEIVSDDVGYLVEADKPVDSLLQALKRWLSDENRQKKRETAVSRQRLFYDSDKNHRKFVQFIEDEVLDAN